jgi:hypothetical protein
MIQIRNLAFLLSFIFCMGNIQAEKYFKILDATSQSWSGGMAQTGTGITYMIKVVLLTNQKINFEEIWIGKQYGLLETHSATYSDGRTMVKGDTALLTYTIHHYPPNSPMAQMNNPVSKPCPIYTKAAAVIGFSFDKIKKYRTVQNFRDLPVQRYP